MNLFKINFFNLFTQKSFNKISGEQLKEMLESSTPPLLIDIKISQEYAGGHISKIKNIPVRNFEDTIKKMELKLGSFIVVYCKRMLICLYFHLLKLILTLIVLYQIKIKLKSN